MTIPAHLNVAPLVVDKAATLMFFAPGIPAPQGSKKGFSRIGTTGVQMVESSKALKPWRDNVRKHAAEAALEQSWAGFDAVAIGLAFWMPRPKSHPKRRRTIHSTRPDADKLTRGVLDALTQSGVIRDDSTVVKVTAVKAYVHPPELAYPGEATEPGVFVSIREARDGEMPDVF